MLSLIVFLPLVGALLVLLVGGRGDNHDRDPLVRNLALATSLVTFAIAPDAVEATYDSGVLQIVLPKVPPRRVIPRSVRVSEAPGYGQSVLTYDPGSRGSTSYVEAARELAHRGVDLPPIDRTSTPGAAARFAVADAAAPQDRQ